MLTFISFLLTFFGTFNWLFIGAFQYDIIAGFFGYQASLFSRVFYFIIGVAGFVLLFMAIKNKGVIKITENSFKKKKVKIKEEEKKDDNFVLSQEEEKDEKTEEGYKDFDITQYDK